MQSRYGTRPGLEPGPGPGPAPAPARPGANGATALPFKLDLRLPGPLAGPARHHDGTLHHTASHSGSGNCIRVSTLTTVHLPVETRPPALHNFRDFGISQEDPWISLNRRFQNLILVPAMSHTYPYFDIAQAD